MRLFNKVQEIPRGSSIKRISNLETAALKTWFDSTLISMGTVYDKWRFHDGAASEVYEHLHILDELWKEIQNRS